MLAGERARCLYSRITIELFGNPFTFRKTTNLIPLSRKNLVQITTLNIENQLRLVQMRVHNPDDVISLIYAMKLSEKSHAVIGIFVQGILLPSILLK